MITHLFCNSPFVVVYLFFVDGVAAFREDSGCLFYAFFSIKFNIQGTLLLFSVVEDTNILDTDIMIGQNGSNICDGTGSVGNINAEGIRGFDRTAGSIDEGIPVFSGTAEKS